MALNKKDLITLTKLVAEADPSASISYSFEDKKYSYGDLKEILKNELKEIAGTYQLYKENEDIILELVETVIDDVLPKKVLEQLALS